MIIAGSIYLCLIVVLGLCSFYSGRRYQKANIKHVPMGLGKNIDLGISFYLCFFGSQERNINKTIIDYVGFTCFSLHMAIGILAVIDGTYAALT